MGHVTRLRKLRKLEGRISTVAAELAELSALRREQALEAALSRLDTDALAALGPLIDAALAKLDAQASPSEATHTNLFALASTASERRSVAALQRALEAAVQSEEQAKLTRGA